MKRKKIMCVILGTAMLCILSACGKEKLPLEEIFLPTGESGEMDTTPEVEEEQIDSAQSKDHGVHNIHMMRSYEYDTVYDSETYADRVECLTSMQYPRIFLEECCEKEYPELAKELSEINSSEEEKVLEEYGEMLPEAKQRWRENPDYFGTFSIKDTVFVRRADSNVLSLLYRCYDYYGGNHGSHYYYTENIDPLTGDEVELSDVVTDPSALPNLLKDCLLRDYGTNVFFNNDTLSTYFSENLDDLAWVLDYQGLTFYFYPYEIAGYAAGSFSVSISFAEYPELFTEKYQKIPDSYAVELVEYDPYYYDLDQDGSMDKIQFYGNWSSYGDTKDKHVISVNDQEIEFDAWSFELDGKFIHTADGGSYLYIQDVSENDCRSITVYDLSNDNVQRVDSITKGWYSEEYDKENYEYREQILTDLEQFKLATRTDVLSTVDSYKNYRVGQNGMPETEDEWYVIGRELIFTAKKDIVVDKVDEKTGEIGGTATIKAGKPVVYYRVNNENTAELRLKDGSVVRVVVDKNNWPYSINGENIEDLFEGLIFAG